MWHWHGEREVDEMVHPPSSWQSESSPLYFDNIVNHLTSAIMIIIFTPCPTLLSIWEMEVAVTLSWVSTIGTRQLITIKIVIIIISIIALLFSTISMIYLREVGTRLQRRQQELRRRRCQGFHSGLLLRGRGLWTSWVGQKFIGIVKKYFKKYVTNMITMSGIPFRISAKWHRIVNKLYWTQI